MNRKQCRAIQQKNMKGINLDNSMQAQKKFENLPVATLVVGINNSLDILRKRGISISDWDKKERKLYGLKVFSGRVYFLAADQNEAEKINNSKESEADESKK